MHGSSEIWGSGSRSSPHARLMTNRLAYEVLEALYHIIPAGTRAGPALDDPINVSLELHEYQNWLHARLPASGLAKGLAAGPDFLPDISTELPQFWRTVARLTAPRNYRQLTAQVARNLSWYLGDGIAPVTPAHKLRACLLPAVLLASFVLVPLIAATNLSHQPWPVFLLCWLLLFALILSSIWQYGSDTTGKFRANCAELYAYLLEAYAEPGADGENQVQSILEERGRDTANTNAALARRARKRAYLPTKLR